MAAVYANSRYFLRHNVNGDSMRKRFTKIICAAVAVISAAALAFTPACSSFKGVTGEKDTATEAVKGTNGGFSVETTDYVYFINGNAASTDTNNFGSVVKGSVQRIKKTDLAAYNYSSTETVVPSVIYSGQYDAGLYIYDGYLYYTTPSTSRNPEGEVLNSYLDFKRTKLDGTDTTNGYIWQSSSTDVDYRYVKVDDTVYILYSVEEDLSDDDDDSTTTQDIYSVNCFTGEKTMIAYNVAAYSFDTEDPENPYVYYTMAVPEAMGGSSDNISYNQIYRARADVTEATAPRTYDYSGVEDYEDNKDEYPIYVNLGDFVFDGIGKLRASDGLTQFNYGYEEGGDNELTLTNSDYSYDIQWYKNGYLYYTRNEGSGDTRLYRIADSDITSSWNAITENEKAPVFVAEDYTTEYTFVTMNDEVYAIETASDGIYKKTVSYDSASNSYKFGTNVKMIKTSSAATALCVREDCGHTYLYYSVSGGNGYTINRLAIDGAAEQYNSLLAEEAPDYTGVQILDLDACTDWYLPEFVTGTNTLLFAAEVEGMTDYNYVMACDLSDANGDMMDNGEIEDYNEQYEAIMEKIEAYDEIENSDGTLTYENLSGALKYEFYTRDNTYLEELRQAYVDVLDKDIEYLYSDETVEKYNDFYNCEGDWATDADLGSEGGTAYAKRTVRGEEVYANTRDYYYALIGNMSEDDEESYLQAFKDNTDYMQEYPTDDIGWWDDLSTGGKAGFIIGMIYAGEAVIAAAFVTAILLLKRSKKNKELIASGKQKMNVDITDDKNVNVYGNDEKEQ